MSLLCNYSSGSRFEYNSWEYVFIQRARLLIGRQVNFGTWGFTSIKKLLMRISGLKIGYHVEVAGKNRHFEYSMKLL